MSIHHWIETAQPLGERSAAFRHIPTIQLNNATLNFLPKIKQNIRLRRDMRISVASLFVIALCWKHPSAGEWMWYSCTMEFYTAVKKKKKGIEQPCVWLSKACWAKLTQSLLFPFTWSSNQTKRIMITEFISVGIGGKLEGIKKELSEETVSCRLSVSYSGVGIYQNVHRTLHLFVSLCKFTHLKKNHYGFYRC